MVLRQRVLSGGAAEAIARIGPVGRDAFADVLLAELDAPGNRRAFAFADAPAAVARDDPELIRGLIRRALADPWPVAAGAIDTLGALGPSVLQLEPDLVAKLLRREVPEPAFPMALHPALGRIRRDDARLLVVLLDLAGLRPPRIVRVEGGYDCDANRGERGAALESLANFTRFPERVVPVLIDALDTFEEYDPNWGYERDEHGRVVASLRAFGPAAAPAVPVLARHLRQSKGDVDWEVIRLLGDIGPPAAAALPALEALNDESTQGQGTEPRPPKKPSRPTGPPILCAGPSGESVGRREPCRFLMDNTIECRRYNRTGQTAACGPGGAMQGKAIAAVMVGALVWLCGCDARNSPVAVGAAAQSSEAEGQTEAGLVKVKVFNKRGELVGPVESARVVKTDAEWQKQLTPEQYQIARAKGTEPAFCGNLLDNKKEGVYACVCCGLPLFSSDSKFHSGTGWPSFFQPVAPQNVIEHVDRSYGMERDEILCARCDGHLGHVFNDGPRPTGLRFCVNSESLRFVEKSKLATLADPAAEAGAGKATAEAEPAPPTGKR